MRKQTKTADITPGSAASPLPQTEITPKPATGKRGPTGIGPRTNYSRVNTGTPPPMDTGAAAQKNQAPRGAEMLPKLGFRRGEDFMKTSVAARPSLHDLVKAAEAGALSRVNLSEEAARQQRVIAEEKTAAVASQDESIPTEFCIKMAEALDYVAEKVAAGASLAGPYKLSEGHVEPGTGPGALTVMQAQASGSPPGPGQQGAGHAQPPKNPPQEKGRPQEHSPSNMGTNYSKAPGGSTKMLEKNNEAKLLEGNMVHLAKLAEAGRKTAAEKTAKEKDGCCEKCGKEKCSCGGKMASAEPVSLVDYMLQTVKQAEDAINPAQISAGAAVAPDTSAAGEAGGAPVGGAPQGPTGLVGSNESAIGYKRNAAYANRKTDLGKYWTEPAMSSATDKTLQEAFSHTGEAGTKFSSAQPSMKVAAARALLLKLAEEASEKKAEKEKDEFGMGSGIPMSAPRPGRVGEGLKKVLSPPRPAIKGAPSGAPGVSSPPGM